MTRLPLVSILAMVDSRTLRERLMIFAALAILLVSLVDALLFAPLRVQQQKLALQVAQQQEQVQAAQGQLKEMSAVEQGHQLDALRSQVAKLQQQFAVGTANLESRRDKLVSPERMTDLLEQVLGKNGHLQLVSLETGAAIPLGSATRSEAMTQAHEVDGKRAQVYRHDVKLTVRGSYPDLVQYLTALEKLSGQMYWSSAKMTVLNYPVTEMTLTVYTLSMDAAWLRF